MPDLQAVSVLSAARRTAIAADGLATLRRVPRGRRRRIAAALLCPPLAVLIAYLWWGPVHPATSAPNAYRRAALPAPEQGRKPPSAVTVAADKSATVYRIAFFGDSVSVGYLASDRAHGYVALVARRLRSQGRRVFETVDAKGGVPVAYWEFAPIPKRLDAAVVELGTNDVQLGTGPARFAVQYRTLTRRIHAASPAARVLCLSVWSRPGEASLDDVINVRIRAVCPGTYVDITWLRNRPGIRARDAFHPNDVGYRLIARAVLSKLKTS